MKRHVHARLVEITGWTPEGAEPDPGPLPFDYDFDLVCDGDEPPLSWYHREIRDRLLDEYACQFVPPNHAVPSDCEFEWRID